MTAGAFLAAFDGRFRGVMGWDDLDALWARIEAAPEGWYVYHLGEPPPRAPASAAALVRFLRDTRAHLRRAHGHDYCGIVYADSLQAPGFVKVYDPGNLGASCGASGVRVMPGWILSRIAPEPLAAPPAAESRWRRWRGLLGLG